MSTSSELVTETDSHLLTSDSNENTSDALVDAGSTLSTSQSLLYLLLIFSTSVLGLFLVYLNFPSLNPSELVHVKILTSVEDAKNLGMVLSRYTGDHFYTVLAGFFLIYIFLQTFAIPGSIFLSLLSGYLFPFPVAILTVCTCSALGASCCYFISNMVGRRIVYRLMPERAAQWATQVEKHRSNLLSYIIFLRVTPILPNWFINVVSPIINIPLKHFFFGTFLGVAPPSLLIIKLGTTLHQIQHTNEAFSLGSVAFLIVTALLSLAPILLRRYFKSKLE